MVVNEEGWCKAINHTIPFWPSSWWSGKLRVAQCSRGSVSMQCFAVGAHYQSLKFLSTLDDCWGHCIQKAGQHNGPRFLVCFNCPSPHANTHIPPSPAVSSAHAACVDLDPQRPSHLLLICPLALSFINHALTLSCVSLWLKRGEEEVGQVTSFVSMLHCITFWILIHFDLQFMCLFTHGDFSVLYDSDAELFNTGWKFVPLGEGFLLFWPLMQWGIMSLLMLNTQFWDGAAYLAVTCGS